MDLKPVKTSAALPLAKPCWVNWPLSFDLDQFEDILNTLLAHLIPKSLGKSMRSRVNSGSFSTTEFIYFHQISIRIINRKY
jgi:hypothetical protein